MTTSRPLLLALLAGTLHSPAWAQPAPAPAEPSAAPAAAEQPADAPLDDAEAFDEEFDEDAVEVEGVVVTGGRGRGAVLGDIEPEVQLNAREVRALGVSSITELLEVLAPQIQSGRGRGGGQPVTLLNGRRISGFSELRGIPPEAIQRVDILPEEVALKYGYRADQRVVNFVLRRRFRSETVEVQGGRPTAGGRADTEVEAGLFRINRDGRWSVDAEHRRSSSLLESERDLERSRTSGPFDLVGNVGALTPGAEIDPALSAMVGRPVTSAGAPASAATVAPTLADFAAGGGVANSADLRPFRTLSPESERLSVNGTYNRTIFGDVGATVNASFDHNTSRSLFGLPSTTLTLPADSPFSPFADDVLLYRYSATGGPLARETESGTAHLGGLLDGFVSSWRWSLTGNLDRTESVTRTDAGLGAAPLQAALDAGDAAFNPFAPFPADRLLARPRDEARSMNQIANAELVFNGTLAELAAGPVSSTFRGTLEARGFESETFRSGAEQQVELSRERGAVQASIDVPIADRGREVLAALGDLTANANVELEQLSDFGTLRTLGAGLNWSPVEKLDLIASVTDEDGAPTMQQLGDPVLLTPNVPVFDFTRGETVDVVRLDGGNAALVADNRRVFKLSATLKPYEERDLSLSVNYIRTRIVDPIASFPAATAEIEAAFPDRFVRDETGRLVQVDTRPVNFLRSDREEVRWGVNFSRPFGRPTPPPAGAFAGARRGGGADGARAQGPRRERPGGGGGFRGGRGGGGRFGGAGQGRLQMSLYHTLRLQDSILVRDGVPELDLLEGSAVGGRGGQPRHEIDAQAGVFRNGFGGFATLRWQSGTEVFGLGDERGDRSGDLTFSDLTTVNLRLFADLTQRRELVERHPWLRGTRVSLAVNNLFDDRLDVRDALGETPISYQPAFIDPIGRSVRVGFRKLFIPRRFLGGQGQGGRGGRRGAPDAPAAGERGSPRPAPATPDAAPATPPAPAPAPAPGG